MTEFNVDWFCTSENYDFKSNSPAIKLEIMPIDIKKQEECFKIAYAIIHNLRYNPR
ncbi:MAG TPA: hypothetical protein VIK78_20590 [Ruminiclostridium sp.]